MNSLLLDASKPLIGAIIVVGILLAVTWVVCFIIKGILVVRYTSFNRRKVDNGLTGATAARLLLDSLDLKEVEVECAGFFGATMYGNHYNARKKIIKLRRHIYEGNSVTAIGIATQKVGLAVLQKEKQKTARIRSAVQPFMFLAPFIAIPIALVSFGLDVAINSDIGWITIIGSIVAGIYYVCAFIYTLFTIPVEKNANKKALDLLEKTNMLNADELADCRSLFKTFIISYVVDFILDLLYIIREILKLLLSMAKNKR